MRLRTLLVHICDVSFVMPGVLGCTHSGVQLLGNARHSCVHWHKALQLHILAGVDCDRYECTLCAAPSRLLPAQLAFVLARTHLQPDIRTPVA